MAKEIITRKEAWKLIKNEAKRGRTIAFMSPIEFKAFKIIHNLFLIPKIIYKKLEGLLRWQGT